LAVDLLLIYYLHQAQLGVMGDHIVSGGGEPAGGGVVDDAVSGPLLPNDANDAGKGVVESLHGGAKEDGEKQYGKRGRKQHEVWPNLAPDADPCKNTLPLCKHCSIHNPIQVDINMHGRHGANV
jgi:hypothetical protein